MKIVVSGGAGFIGSHLCQKLLEEGHQVICLDNLLTSTGKNIESFKDNPNFTFIKTDVSEQLPADLEADQVFHLASPASPNKHSSISYLAFPEQTMLANTVGTRNMAELAIKSEAKFLFASTSEVYGDPLEHPQKETYRGNVSTTGPRAVYDESKRFGETIVSTFVRKNNLDARIIRIFNTFGPGMADDGRVVYEFVKASLKGEKLPIFGDGNQTRSFCFVSDLVEGLIEAMNKEGTKGEVFNLGNPQEFSVMELAKKIIELTGSNSEISLVEPLPEDDPKKRCPDIAKAKEVLGWDPKVSLDEGLKKFINSF